MMNDLLQQALQGALSRDKGLLGMGASLDDLTATYPYYQDGQELFVKVRFDKDGKKWIKPFHFNGKYYKMGEPKAIDKKPLYQPKPLGDVVYIVEGEKCVHALINIGLTATTTGGATSVDKCDLTPLQGRKCVLWRDNDDSGIKWQGELANALDGLNIAYSVIDIAGVKMPNGDDLPPKGDCYDFIKAFGKDDDVIWEVQHLPLLDLSLLNTDNANDLLALDEQVIQLQSHIAELANLDEMRLHLLLPQVAKRYSISKDRLLQWVYEYKQGDLVTDPTPFDTAVSHDEIYTALYELVNRHIVIDEPLKVAFVLWVMFSYLVDISDIAPIAWITAPEKSCGKSTLLGLFERVVNRPFVTQNPTMAVIYRVMERYKPTLLVDEIDTNLKHNDKLLGIVNSGYSRHNSKTARTNMDKGGGFDVFDSFGAKVFCGIGEMKGTFASRAIRFELRRKGKDDKVHRLNKATLPHSQTDIIRQKCKRWAMDNRQAVAGVQIELLPIDDRSFDNWYILLQIATVLGKYDTAKHACLAMCQIKGEPSINEQLLADIREIWNGERMSSKLLLEKLNALDEAMWQTINNGQEMTAHQFAKKLKSFGIKSKDMRIKDNPTTIKGFLKSDFQKVWDNYLPPPQADENPFLLPQIQ
ncbi:DUF3631 domain-containing protein [Moraxella nasovis]|uniref:DUF3631 domain-containing protein n=1 Tax=Moraxella nasovis TaxID=2904121 RepID=UPI001F615E87|nr:DUF3631 domain-containing protein [Moraxella nasovis]UNU73653.1 DUF3631 domain-containing protein [Moraxella nasovis]